MNRRKMLLPLLLLMFTGGLFGSIPKLQVEEVSAVPLSPYIMIVPEQTVNSTITPGMNYTIAIYTDYSGSDVWLWQFSLTFNPNVLEGIEVRNGDLITRTKNSTARFYPGSGFDNTQGTLSLVTALFYYRGENERAYKTSGPGTFAYVTFKVIDTGIANITLGDDTSLAGSWYDEMQQKNIPYPIIDAAQPPGRTELPYGSDHIGHGYFNNIPPIHDVAVTMDYTAAIYTDYNGSNICAWQFNLTFNPAVLKGIEVLNGDLITTTKHDNAVFTPGTFNDTAGILSLNQAYFGFLGNIGDTTYGPGTLAYVNFKVVGTGDSNITFGSATQLLGVNRTALPVVVYTITDAGVSITPLTAILGDIVPTNVDVVNKGNFTETFDVKAYVNNTLIGTQTVNGLAIGGRTTLTFDWNTTTGVTAANYIINATAELLDDEHPDDNTRATLIRIKTLHDVAVVDLGIPATGTIGELVTINVNITNQGTFEENVNLTIYYQPGDIPFPPEPEVANTTLFMLAKRPTSTVIELKWNTAGLEAHQYVINATVTIGQDDDLLDNILLNSTTLTQGHDLKVTSVSVEPLKVFVGETVTISVTIQNVGGFNETLFEVKVIYNTTILQKEIERQQVPSLLVGNSVILSFSWNTAGVDPDLYRIEAEAVLETDTNPDNNKKRAFSVFVAAPIGQIAGIVKDTSGNPIEGATVTAGTYTNTTNVEGYYKLSNVLAGNYTVIATKNGYQTSSQTNIKVDAGQTKNLNFTLTPLITTGHIIGRVTDASTGNPIEGAQVTAGGHSASTNATGDYSVELAAGTYNVTVSSDGYESSSETGVDVTAGGTTTVDFELTPAQPLNILPYAVAVIVVIFIIAGITVYLRRRRKTE